MGRHGLSDTSAEALDVLARVHRSMAPARKWALCGDLFRQGRDLHAMGVRSRSPAPSWSQIRADWLARQYGFRSDWPAGREGFEPVQPIENTGVVHEVIRAFDHLEIPYALGGSFASSIHGFHSPTRPTPTS